MTPPRVSVILPLFNAAAYVEKAVESILRQTFDSFELLVVDDHSTDDGPDKCRGFRDSRLRVIPNEGPKGVARAFNAGLQHARGSLIARMDADDVSFPNRFELQVEYLDKNPNVHVLGTGIEIVDASGKVRKDPSIRPLSPNHVRWSLLFYCSVAFPTVMARRDVLAELGGCDSTASPADDYDLWLRASRAGFVIANLKEILLRYRINPTGLSHAPSSPMDSIALGLAASRLGELLHADVEEIRGPLELVRNPHLITRNNNLALRVRAAASLIQRTVALMQGGEIKADELRAIRGHARQMTSRLHVHALKNRPRLLLDNKAGIGLPGAVRVGSHLVRGGIRRIASGR